METTKVVTAGGVGGNEQAEHRGVQGSENALYGVIKMGICIYTFVQMYRVYNTKSEPKVNYGH